ncbi:hypothetical protein BH11MYX2_BH11MYX2_15100 [soil metagenome]
MKRLTPIHILVIGWLIAVISAYPGYMDAAAADQLFDSRAHVITDWHSPVFSAVWGSLEVLMAGPVPMLALQVTLTLVGAYVLLARSQPEKRAALGACAVVLFPPVLVTIGQLSAQVAFAAFLIAGFAALTSEHRRWKVAGIVLLVIAAAMQPTGASAVVPLIVARFQWSEQMRTIQRVAVASGLAIVVVAASILLDRSVVDAVSERDAVTRAYEQISMAVERSPAMDDASLRAEMPGIELLGSDLHVRIAERSRHGRSLLVGDAVVREPETSGEREALFTARDNVLRDHSGALWAYRYRIALRVLGVVRGKNWRPVYTRFVPSAISINSLQHRAKSSPPQKWIYALLKPLAKTPLFWPYLYVALVLVMLPFGILRRAYAAAVLLVSGLVFEISLVFVDVNPGFRDSHWLICSTVLALVLSWPSLRRKAAPVVQPDRPRPEESPVPASAA